MCMCDVCVCEWMESSSACLERVDIAFLQVTTIFSAHVATPHPPPAPFPHTCCRIYIVYDTGVQLCVLSMCSRQHRLPGWKSTRNTCSMSCLRVTPPGYSVCLNVPCWRTAWCLSCGSSTQNTWSVAISDWLK